jgi:hypothetical protein
MKHSQVVEALKIHKPVEDDDVNPLRVAINHEFNRRVKPLDGELPDYRERAIDLVVKARLNFSSEWNTTSNLAKRFLKAICPSCGNTIESRGGGGNSHVWTLDFHCAHCGTHLTLTMPHDGIVISFPEVDKFKV